MTTSKLRLFSLLAALLMALGLASPALARALDAARRAGFVGEQADGYLGIVSASAPADVVRQVQEVNAQRRAVYAQIAQQRGAPVSEVGKLQAQTLISSETRSGEFYRDANGAWVRRP
jgi:uncharacterized protein YdbL (DUF1318 family)